MFCINKFNIIGLLNSVFFKKSILFFLILICLFQNSLHSKSVNYLSKKNRELYEFKTKNKSAIKLFESGRETYNSKEYFDALEKFISVDQMDSTFSHNVFYLGKVYYMIKDYENALLLFKRYLSLGTEETLMRNEIRNLQVSSQKKIDMEKVFLNQSYSLIPNNLGAEINSIHDEMFPYFVNDKQEIYFLRRIKKSGENLQETSRIYYSRKNSDGNWSKSIPVEVIDNSYYVGGFSVYRNKDWVKIYFSSCNSKNTIGGCDIYLAINHKGRWYEPLNLRSSVNSVGYDSHPSISFDGNVLYFSSDRKNGFGKQDIWSTRKNSLGIWETPTPLSININSFGSEQAPFIHKNGNNIYFSTNSFTSFGGFDIYKSDKDDFNYTGKNWTKAENIGQPFNSINDDISIFITYDSKEALISTDYFEGFGGYDIFKYDIEDKLNLYTNTYVSNSNAHSFAQNSEDKKKSLKNTISGFPQIVSTKKMNKKDLYKFLNTNKITLNSKNINFSNSSKEIKELEHPFFYFNNVLFTSDSTLYEFNGQFFSYDNVLRVGPEGLISFDNGKLTIYNGEIFGMDGKLISKSDILKLGIKNVSVSNNEIYYKKYKIDTEKSSVIVNENIRISSKGIVFDKDNNEIYNFYIKSNNPKFKRYYSKSFSQYELDDELLNDDLSESKMSFQFNKFINENGLTYDELYNTLNDSKSFITITDGVAYIGNGTNKFMKYYKGEFWDLEDNLISKNNFSKNKIKVRFENSNAILSNGYKVYSDGFIELPNGSLIHTSLLIINSEGKLIEPYK